MNHQPKKRHKTFTDLLNRPTFKDLLDAIRAHINQLLANNQRLLLLSEISVYRQCKDIRERTNLNFTESNYSQLKSGKRLTCGITFMGALAQYWGLTIHDMLSPTDVFEGIIAEKLPEIYKKMGNGEELSG